jgi:hypothetical protein
MKNINRTIFYEITFYKLASSEEKSLLLLFHPISHAMIHYKNGNSSHAKAPFARNVLCT